jgi:hypothetical protein
MSSIEQSSPEKSETQSAKLNQILAFLQENNMDKVVEILNTERNGTK